MTITDTNEHTGNNQHKSGHNLIYASSTIPMTKQQKIIKYNYIINYNMFDTFCIKSLLQNAARDNHQKILNTLTNILETTQKKEHKKSILNTAQLLIFALHHIVAVRIFGIRKQTTKKKHT